MFWCKQASRESTVNNLQHNWFATLGHCLFCIEWLLEEPFCVAEVFSMDWLRPLKLDIWFRTFRDARRGKFFFLDIKQPSSNSSSSSSAFWLNESPSSSSLSSPSSFSSSPARLIWKQFFGKVLVMLNVCIDVCDSDQAWLACWNFVSLLEVVQVIVFSFTC